MKLAVIGSGYVGLVAGVSLLQGRPAVNPR